MALALIVSPVWAGFALSDLTGDAHAVSPASSAGIPRESVSASLTPSCSARASATSAATRCDASPTGRASSASSLHPSSSSPPASENELFDQVGVGSGPEGMVYDYNVDCVYVANEESDNVSVISDATNTVVANVPVGDGPTTLAFDPGTSEVFVVNDDSDNVSVISDATNKVVANIHVGDYPDAVAFVSGPYFGEIYVANGDSNNVSVISDATNTVVANFAVGSFPRSIVYDSGDEYLYIANEGSEDISVVSGEQVIASVDVSQGMGNVPEELAYDSDNGIVYATSSSDDLSLVSGVSLGATVDLGYSTLDISYDSGNGDVYLGTYGTEDALVVVNGTNFVTGLLSNAEALEGLVYDPTYGDLYIATTGSDTIQIMSTVTQIGALSSNTVAFSAAVVGTVGVGANPYFPGFDPSNGYVYVPVLGSDTVSVLSGSTIVTTVTVGSDPFAAVFDPVNGYMYVTDAGSGDVSLVCGVASGCGAFAEDTVVGTVALGAGSTPRADAFDPDNGYVYVADGGSNAVSILSGTTVVKTRSVGASPYGVGYDSGNGDVYVSNRNSFNVTVLSGTSVVANLGVGLDPEGVAYDSDNGWVYVANEGSGTVNILWDTTVLSSFPVGANPVGVGYDNVTGYVYVANSGSQNLTVVLGNATVASVGVGTNPDGVAFDSQTGTAYVSNYNSANVSLVTTTQRALAGSTGLEMDDGEVAVLWAPLTMGAGWTEATVVTPPSLLVCSPTNVTDLQVTVVCLATIYSGTLGLPLSVSVTDTLGTTVTTSGTVETWYAPSWGLVLAAPATTDVGQSFVIHAQLSSGSDPAFTVTWTGPGAVSCGTLYRAGGVELDCGSTAPVNPGIITLSAVDSVGLSAGSTSVSFVISPDPTLGTPTSTPSALDVGQSTSLSVSGTLGSGGPVYSWSGLPPGCLSSNSPTLSCAPTAAGIFSIRASLKDSNGENVTSGVLTLPVSPALGTGSLTVSRPALDVGQTTQLAFTTSGGTGTYAYAWAGLPGGCVSLDLPTLDCSPSVAGSYLVDAWANDSNGASSQASVSLSVSPDPTVSTPVANLTGLDLGQSVAWTVTSSVGAGLTATYAWIGLPAGCPSSDAASVTCRPSGTGTSEISVSVTDSNGGSATSGTLSFTVSPELSVPTLSGSSDAVDVGQEVTFVAAASGGSAPYAYVWSGLPSECASANTPSLPCDPQVAGGVSVSVSVTDANGVVTTSAPYALSVFALPTIAAPSASPSALDVGQSTTLQVTDTVGTPTSTLAWYGLPTGCSSADAASLTCTPTAAGTFLLWATVTDANGVGATSSPILVEVDPALGTPVIATSSSSVPVGTAVMISATATGGAGPYSYTWTGLPTGCVSTSSALVVCTPTASGSFSVSVSVTDAHGETQTSTSSVSVSVTSATASSSTSSSSSPSSLEYAALALGVVALLVALGALLLGSRGRGDGGDTPSGRADLEPGEKPAAPGTPETPSESSPKSPGTTASSTPWDEEPET